MKGRILSSIGDNVVIDCGYKSEGMIPKFEFDDPSEIKIGEEVEVLLEAVEDDSGLIKLSKRKADRIRGWERIIAKYKERDSPNATHTQSCGWKATNGATSVFALSASQIDVK